MGSIIIFVGLIGIKIDFNKRQGFSVLPFLNLKSTFGCHFSYALSVVATYSQTEYTDFPILKWTTIFGVALAKVKFESSYHAARRILLGRKAPLPPGWGWAEQPPPGPAGFLRTGLPGYRMKTRCTAYPNPA